MSSSSQPDSDGTDEELRAMRTVQRNRKPDKVAHPRYEGRCAQLVAAGWRGEYQPNYVKLPPGCILWQAQLPKSIIFDNNADQRKNTLTFGTSQCASARHHDHHDHATGNYFSPYLAVLSQVLLLKHRKTIITPEHAVDKEKLAQRMVQHVNALADAHGMHACAYLAAVLHVPIRQLCCVCRFGELCHDAPRAEACRGPRGAG